MAADSGRLAEAENNEWISLSGDVVSSTGDSFILEYGEDDLVVEMDGFDFDNDNPLIAGDRVMVTGRVDSDFVGGKRLEAGTVYVESLNEYFFASAADEEDGYYTTYVRRWPSDENWLVISGEVTAIEDVKFTLETGVTSYTVDTRPLGYNPLDDEGLEKVVVRWRLEQTVRTALA